MTDDRQAGWKGFGLAFLIALVVRGVYVFTLEIDEPIRADAQKYFLLAFNLVNHGIYSFDLELPLRADTEFTPGYPWLLALVIYFSDSIDSFVSTTLGLQAVISSLSCALLYALSRRVLSAPAAALCAALLIASPHAIILSGYLLTETLFVFLCLAAVLLLSRSMEAGRSSLFAISGVVFGLAALVRPGLMLFPFFAVGLLLLNAGSLRGVRAKQLGLVLISFTLVFGPWMVWSSANKQIDEDSPVAKQIALGGYPDLIHERPEAFGSPYREDPEYAVMAKSVSAAVSVIAERAKSDPLEYLRWYLFGKVAMYHRANILVGQGGAFIFPVERSLYDISTAASITYAAMMRAHGLLVVAAMLASMLILWRIFRQSLGQSPVLIASAAMLIYFTLSHVVFAPLPRYAIPTHPFIYVLAVFFFAQVIKRVRRPGG